MENNAYQLSAYHEAGRVVFAYLCGYYCDSMELMGSGSGGGSKLNSGNDVSLVQAVLSGDPMALPADKREHGVDVARKLMAVYCAGTCAQIFFENDRSMPEELELDIPAQDHKYIDHIQAFLEKAVPGHAEDYPAQTIVAIFKKLKDPEAWKPIEMLANKVLETESKTLNRFYIEDTLMVAGIKPFRVPVSTSSTGSTGYSVGVHEGETPKPKPSTTQATASMPDLESLTPLDVMLRDFLKKIKKDWQPGELDASMKYLHDVYKKFG